MNSVCFFMICVSTYILIELHTLTCILVLVMDSVLYVCSFMFLA